MVTHLVDGFGIIRQIRNLSKLAVVSSLRDSKSVPVIAGDRVLQLPEVAANFVTEMQ